MSQFLGRFWFSFICSFFPGFLLLIALKSETSDLIKTILFSVGLSLALLMFIGFVINGLYPNSRYFQSALNNSAYSYDERSYFISVPYRVERKYS